MNIVAGVPISWTGARLAGDDDGFRAPFAGGFHNGVVVVPFAGPCRWPHPPVRFAARRYPRVTHIRARARRSLPPWRPWSCPDRLAAALGRKACRCKAGWGLARLRSPSSLGRRPARAARSRPCCLRARAPYIDMSTRGAACIHTYIMIVGASPARALRTSSRARAWMVGKNVQLRRSINSMGAVLMSPTGIKQCAGNIGEESIAFAAMRGE